MNQEKELIKSNVNVEIKKNVNLSEKTSMYVGGEAEYFSAVKSVDELKEVLRFANDNQKEIMVIGEGCNTLISDKGINGLVIKVEITGVSKVFEDNDFVDFEVGAGEHWDDFVKYSVDNNLYGIENMSHVPGSVGASVIQNIGCYGQEVSETVISVKVINKATANEEVFRNDQADFNYRKSRFNDINQDKGKFIVTSVIYRLHKNGEVNSNYGDVQKYFKENSITKPDLQIMRQALIKIRDSKFPYPDKPENGTCGSFFNAEVVDEIIYSSIISKLNAKGFSDKADYLTKMKDSFKVAQGFKIPYGILIESLGFKGMVNGGAKILESHAGVINNFTGKATAQAVYDLAYKVIDGVYKEFGVKMKIEPEVIGDFS